LKDGFSLLVLPGGSLEILESHPNSKEQVLVLERRKGFIELALHHGIPLVPVYAFGATDLYDQVLFHLSFTAFFLAKLLRTG